MDSVVVKHLDDMKLRAGQHHFRHEKGHTHVNEQGVWVKCYHRCRTSIASPGFWIGLTLGFPLEHLLWEKAWPFKLLTHWWGL